MSKKITTFSIIILLIFINQYLSASEYKKPPKLVTDVYSKEAQPFLDLIDFKEQVLEIHYQKHQNLEDLAEEYVELAGEKILRKYNAPKSLYPDTELSLIDLKTLNKKNLNLPKDIKIIKILLSPDKKKYALLNKTKENLEVIIYDLEKDSYKKLDKIKINNVLENGLVEWLNDSRHLVIKILPSSRGEEPKRNIIPDSPIIEETYGKTSRVRTYQNLLTNEFDKKLFDYYFTSQVIIYDTKKDRIQEIGKTGVYDEIAFSPDNKYILVEEIIKPYSYQVPYYYFPKKFYIWNKKGEVVRELCSRPLQDQIPIGGTYKGPRYFRWQALKDASIVWIEALDEGDPKNIVPFRDKTMRLNAPFMKDAEELFKTEHRYSGI